MSETTEEPRVDWPEVPTSAWALAWSFVLGQLLTLAERGAQPSDDWPGSIVLGVVLVVLVSHGVMRARGIRFWFVVVLLVLSAVVGFVGLVQEPSPWDALAVVLSLVQLALLRDFHQSRWFALQRERVPGAPSLAPILLVAVVVGVTAGVLGADTDGVNATFHVRV